MLELKIMLLPIFIIGLISSIVTEFLKLFPWLGATKERKRIMAFTIALIISLIYAITRTGAFLEGIIPLLAGSVAASFIVYKSIIQSIEGLAIGLNRSIRKAAKAD